MALEQEALKIKTDGKGLIELTTYDGIALWWFYRFDLYDLPESSPLIKLLTRNTYFDLFASFLYNFFASTLISAPSRHPKEKTDRKQRPKVLVVDYDVYWRDIRDLTGRLRKGNAYYDFLMAELKKRNFKIVTVYPPVTPISGLKMMIDKSKRQKGIIHKVSNTYWHAEIWKKEYEAKRYFRKIWKSILKNDETFVDLLGKYRLKAGLSYCFNHSFGALIRRIEMAKELVEREKPDLILLTSEYGHFERALVTAGKLKGIPTLALQHGFIGPLHKGYMYPKNSISASGSIEAPYCPIPDKTAVYGEYYYDLLTRVSAYPPSSVAVTGAPRYDVLAVADKIFSRKEFCARSNLDPDRKIVLVATQGWHMRETFIRSVLTALKHFPEVQIVVKPHPNEKEDFYENVAKKENIRVTILPSKSDTFDALYACDLLVSAFSTTITEAVILGKLVVTLNLTAEEPAPYYREVTLRVNRKEDLAPAIRKALYDEKTRKRLKIVGRKFTLKHACRQDGKATERVASLIEQMINEFT